MGSPDSPAALMNWKREQIKDLLCSPQRLLQTERWASWLGERGGIVAVYRELRAYPLPERQRTTLEAILDNPGRTAQYYADRLGVDSTTFFRYRLSLFETLRDYLNASQPVTPPRRSNLPAAVTTFIGRRHELQMVGELLQRPAVRLLTLVGAGGTGKTRLALEVARQCGDHYPDGSFFVDLAALTDAALLPATMLQSLGVAPESGREPLECLTTCLQDKHRLLVIDSFEQLGAGAALLTRLVEAAPQLKVLVTSRSRLHLTCEHMVEIHPLRLPDPAVLPPCDSLHDYDAIQLFIERARAAQPDFSLDTANAAIVVDICRRLEGLPLAIELAAARMRQLSLPMMRERLQNRLIFLAGSAPDRPPRQQSLRALFAWSYDRLDVAEQQVFHCLGMAGGACTLAMIERIVSTLYGAPPEPIFDLVAALVDQSLIHIVDQRDHEARYDMLEIVREYALEQLHAHAEIALFSSC